MYNRYAESARVNWTLNFAAQDPKHKQEWLELVSPKSIGLILRSIKTDYKFVSAPRRPVGSLRVQASRAPCETEGAEETRIADWFYYQADEVA